MERPSDSLRDLTRRHFFKQAAGFGIGSLALNSLLNNQLLASPTGDLGGPHFAPKAKRIIFLFMAGAPSQLVLAPPGHTLANRPTLSGAGATREYCSRWLHPFASVMITK